MPKQREIVAKIADVARDGGIHDTLVYFDDQIANGLRLCRDGVELPTGLIESLHYDWVVRCAGEPWPDDEK